MTKYTDRQIDAVRALNEAVAKSGGKGVTPSRFAVFFWPGKTFARGNGPWGLGPDSSGLHGGKMLTRLHKLGLAMIEDHDGYWTARLTGKGLDLLNGAEEN